MGDESDSVSQTVGGNNRPLFDLRENPDDARRFVDAQAEVYDLVAAFVARSIADSDLSLKLSFILRAHKIGFSFIDKNAGQIRNVPVSLTNSQHVPPPHEDVLILLEELCDFVNDNFRNISGSYLSAYFLWRLLWIHPFVEGNGSIGRLIAYAIIQISYGSVLPGAKTLPVLLAEHRQNYYDALVDADEHFKRGEINIEKIEELICRLL